jgi:hypothetical protein
LGVAEKVQLGRTALEAALYGRQLLAALLLLGSGASLWGSELTIAIQQGLSVVAEHLLEGAAAGRATVFVST